MRGVLKGLYFFVFALVMGGVSIFSTHKAKVYQKQVNALETTINDLNQQIKYTEIALNESVSVYQAQIKDLQYTTRNIEAKYSDLLKATRLKAKDVNSVTEVSTVVSYRDTVIAEIDTFGGIKAELVDQFVRIDVEVLPDLNAIIDYEMKDSLTIISVQKKHSWLFGLIKWKEHKETRVINHNPKAKIVNLETITIID